MEVIIISLLNNRQFYESVNKPSDPIGKDWSKDVKTLLLKCIFDNLLEI